MSFQRAVIVNFGLLLSLAFAAMPAQAVGSCSVSCTNGSCSGTGSCSCIAGNPYCTSGTSAQVTNYSSYLRSWDLPGLTSVANEADAMNNALKQQNFPDFYNAFLAHDAAVAKLSADELAIYRKWTF